MLVASFTPLFRWPKSLEQLTTGPGEHLCQGIRHIGRVSHTLGFIPGKIEVARMGPYGEPLLIEGHQSTGPIHDRATRAGGFHRKGLDFPRLGLQAFPLHHLQPGQAPGKTDQATGEQQKDCEKSPIGDGPEVHDPWPAFTVGPRNGGSMNVRPGWSARG
jgi:hypothetical protein